jgi:hypothetical protein
LDIPQLTYEENNILIAEFTEEELFEAILQTEHNKALGQYRFPFGFYKHFWEVIKKDLMNLVAKLHHGVR